jgi:hypothetical protein
MADANPLFNIPTPPAALSGPMLAAPASAAAPAAVPAEIHAETPASAAAAAPRPALPPLPAVPMAAPPATSVGVITAQQSVITFAGAPAAVTLMWKVLAMAVPSLASAKLLAVGLSLAVGMLIYWQSAPVTGIRREKVSGFLFALINSFAIAAAALGIASST